MGGMLSQEIPGSTLDLVMTNYIFSRFPLQINTSVPHFHFMLAHGRLK